MKVVTRTSTFVAVLLLLTLSGWSESKKSVYLAHATNIGGKILPAGNYTARWEGAGEVQLKICKGKDEIASVPVRVIQLSSPAYSDSVLVTNKGGTPSLLQINFGGKKFALQVAGEAGGSGSAAAAK